MNIFEGKRGKVSLGAGIVVLAATLALLWQQNRQLQRASAAVAYGHEVRANLARLLSPVQDVQTGQRDYLLTGEQRFLAAYKYGASLIEPQFERVHRLTRQDARQQAALASLKALLDQHLTTAKESIALRDTAGLDAAQRDVLSGKGTAVLDTIRLALHEMDRHEATALGTNIRAASKAASWTSRLFVLVLAALALSLVAGYFTVATEQRQNRLAQDQIVAAQDTVRVAHNELRNRTVMLQSILDSMGDGVAVSDAEQKLVLCNAAGRQIMELCGQATTPVDGDAAHGLFLPDQQTPLPADQFPLMRAVRGETVAGVEIFVRDATNATTQWLSASGGPLRTEEGTAIGGVVVFQDITQRKLMEPVQGQGQIVHQTETETSFLTEEIPDVFVSNLKSPANPESEKAA
jgi:PAS domain S-box-containing protein